MASCRAHGPPAFAKVTRPWKMNSRLDGRRTFASWKPKDGLLSTPSQSSKIHGARRSCPKTADESLMARSRHRHSSTLEVSHGERRPKVLQLRRRSQPRAPARLLARTGGRRAASCRVMRRRAPFLARVQALRRSRAGVLASSHRETSAKSWVQARTANDRIPRPRRLPIWMATLHSTEMLPDHMFPCRDLNQLFACPLHPTPLQVLQRRSTRLPLAGPLRLRTGNMRLGSPSRPARQMRHGDPSTTGRTIGKPELTAFLAAAKGLRLRSRFRSIRQAETRWSTIDPRVQPLSRCPLPTRIPLLPRVMGCLPRSVWPRSALKNKRWGHCHLSGCPKRFPTQLGSRTLPRSRCQRNSGPRSSASSR